MKRIEWENYQDGDSTPLNAENLNLMQNNIEEELESKIDKAEIIIDGNRKAIKYADGRLECSGTILVTNTPIDIAIGNLFSSAVIPSDDYLVSFVNEPALVFSVEQNASTNRIVDVHPAMGFGTISGTCSFVLSSTPSFPGYNDTNIAPRIHYIAKGFWR